MTLACMYLDYNLRSQIIKFNRSSNQYRIVVKDYSEYITEDENGYQNALTKLNTEILSGSLPDMLVGSSLPLDRYASKGMLVDLWQFIDADESISREDLMTPVLDAMSIDGKLYSIASSFSVETAVGMGKVVGEYDNWTLTEVRDAMTKLQPDATIFSESATKSDVLSSCITRNISSFLGIGRKRSFASEINGSFIESIDNFYIAEYVRYAYPGLITYGFFLICYLGGMIKKCLTDKAVYKVLMTGMACYMLNLLWVDSLQTLKYMYILIAIYICQQKNDDKVISDVKESKYIRKVTGKWG